MRQELLQELLEEYHIEIVKLVLFMQQALYRIGNMMEQGTDSGLITAE